ncbi:hypothetical protein HRbin40_01996 [bacterium HR40]|nr:hypothetical protein HRbin40_01996 [bacterium HR40]
MTTQPRPFWSPLVAGLALGGVLLLTFLVTGHGLGASGFFTRLAAWLADLTVPGWARSNSYFAPLFVDHPLASWISFEMVGVVVGALAGAASAGRFRIGIERGAGIGGGARLLNALFGGVLVGFGARVAQGCTSGIGLSGSATLALAGFVFLLGFFAAGFLVSALVRRAWQ